MSCFLPTLELIAKNLHCESNSDKTINEWLAASSKLSNDSGGNNSLANNTSTSGHTMATTIHNRGGVTGVETHLIINPSSANSASSSAASSASTKQSTNSPRHHELIANCSLLLNDDTDENPSDLDNNNNTKFGVNSSKQRDELESRLLGNSCYQTPQFNRFLISSPLISSKSKSQLREVASNARKDDTSKTNEASEANCEQAQTELTHADPDSESIAKNATVSSSRSNTLSKKSPNSKLPPMMTSMRSHNFTNGNFNAKISTSSTNAKTIVSTPSLSQQENMRYTNNTNTISSTSSNKAAPVQQAWVMHIDIFTTLAMHLHWQCSLNAFN